MRKLIRVLQLTAVVFLIAAPFARRLSADSSYVWFRSMVPKP